MRVRKHRDTRATRSLAKPGLAGAALISYASSAIVDQTANARQSSLCQLRAPTSSLVPEDPPASQTGGPRMVDAPHNVFVV